MRAIIYFFYLCTIFPVLTSCSNALYFYETDKISLTLEARPDSTQPVQGNFGLKQRLALVTPPINKKSGEALSALTSFRFHKAPGERLNFGPVTIKTAFITGDAASELNDKEAVNAATAIVGVNINSGAKVSILRNIVNEFKMDKSNLQAQKLLLQLDALGEIVIPQSYPVALYKAPLDSSSSLLILQILFKNNSPINLSSDIDGVLTYWGQLNASLKILKDVLNNPLNYQFNGKTPDDPLTISGVNDALSKIELEIQRVRSELASNSVYRQSVDYYCDNYL